MKIAIIGTGNVGGALATKWSEAGHEIYLGVRDVAAFKGDKLLSNKNTEAYSVEEAVSHSKVILLATPAEYAVNVAKSLGDIKDKVIIDAMNIVMGKGPSGFTNTSDAILETTSSRNVVKCFNITGFNNMQNTKYGKVSLDMFMAGDSKNAKKVTHILALDAGFETCYDIGGNDKFFLMEQFANFWINLAMVQGQGREIGFKLLRR
jgi:8-hydroxy-5-deazaflavin:NADPH oxidoreductase